MSTGWAALLLAAACWTPYTPLLHAPTMPAASAANDARCRLVTAHQTGRFKYDDDGPWQALEATQACMPGWQQPGALPRFTAAGACMPG